MSLATALAKKIKCMLHIMLQILKPCYMKFIYLISISVSVVLLPNALIITDK